MLQLFPVGPNTRNWGTLAEHFTGSSRPEIKRHAMSAKIGWGDYSSCVCIGVSKEGLSICVDVPFRFVSGDPELLIPWSQIKSLGRTGVFGGGIVLYIKKTRMKIRLGIGILGGWSVIDEIERYCSKKPARPNQALA